MALDAGNAAAVSSLGLGHLNSRRYREAVCRFKRAIELNPNYANAHALLGLALACLSESGRAVALIKVALRLSPRDPSRASWFAMASFGTFVAERYDEGIAWARRGEKENSDWPDVYRVLAANCGQAGRLEEGRAAVAELKRVAPDITVETTRVQMPFENPADQERSLECLRKVGLPEH